MVSINLVLNVDNVVKQVGNQSVCVCVSKREGEKEGKRERRREKRERGRGERRGGSPLNQAGLAVVTQSLVTDLESGLSPNLRIHEETVVGMGWGGGEHALFAQAS